MAAMADTLIGISEPLPFEISWQARNVATGETLGLGAATVRPCQSVRKISVLMAALAAVHDGLFDLDRPVTIKAELQPGVTSGVCQYLTPGVVLPFRDVLTLMIIVSDNVCTYEAMRDLEIDEVTAYCRRLGMVGTTHRTRLPPPGLPADHPLEAVTTSTTADQVHLLDLILRGADDAETAELLGVTPDLCRMALQILKQQRYRNMIPARLPRGTVAANKTGWGPRGFMDAGIVFKDGAPLYIISAFTDRVPDALADGTSGEFAATDAVARLSRACWDAWSAGHG